MNKSNSQQTHDVGAIVLPKVEAPNGHPAGKGRETDGSCSNIQGIYTSRPDPTHDEKKVKNG